MRAFYFLLFTFYFLFGCTSTSMMKLTPAEQEYLAKAKQAPSRFYVAPGKVPEIWGRAQSWIGRYSSMKLQTVTDYIIQTYNPGGSGVNFGYYVTRTDMDSIRTEISVECVTDNPFSGNDRKQNEKLLAYYLQSGILPPSSRIVDR